MHRLIPAILAAVMLVGLGGCAGTASRESTGEYIDDAAITTRVKSALLNEPGVTSGQISVETFRGVVQLSGFVDSDEMRDKAIVVAQRVSGVKAVKNDMRVRPERS
jgi:osmotically-inducible protein OsmY